MRIILTDTKAIATLTDKINKAGRKLDADIQTAALAVANHAHLHGDVTLLNNLFFAMPKGARHSALTAWLLVTAPVVANVDPANKREVPFLYDKTRRLSGDELAMRMSESDSEGAQWFDMKPSPTPDMEFDVIAGLRALLKKAGKEGVTIKAGGEDVLSKLRELAA